MVIAMGMGVGMESGDGDGDVEGDGQMVQAHVFMTGHKSIWFCRI